MTLMGDDLNKELEDLAERISLPDTKYEAAKRAYNHVGEWLSSDGGLLGSANVTIVAQGSQALGTSIIPPPGGDSDIDAVCRLSLTSDQITQEQLKKAVGDRLKSNETFLNMLEPEGQRCWTLRYADSSRFHLDVLPAISDDPSRLAALGVPSEYIVEPLRITHKTDAGFSSDWKYSNPLGYQAWFKDRQKIIHGRRTKVILEKRADLRPLQEYEVRTPLQQVVQLLKRHRDVVFGLDKDKPISMIITTLAAMMYENEPTVLDAMHTVLPKISGLLAHPNSGVPAILNPVDPGENFSDKWDGVKRKYSVFRDWLRSVGELHAEFLKAGTVQKRAAILERGYGAGLGVGGYLLEKYAERRQRRAAGVRPAIEAVTHTSKPWRDR